MRLIVSFAALFCVSLALALPLPASAPAPVPGPGAVVEMHRALFRAIDGGDSEAALAFLQPDMHMDDEYRKRPCQLWFVGADGEPRAGNSYDESRELLADWIAAEEGAGGGYETSVSSRASDCYSGELSYAVLDIERKHTSQGETQVERWRSTSLVTYDRDGWKLTHWHLSAAE